MLALTTLLHLPSKPDKEPRHQHHPESEAGGGKSMLTGIESTLHHKELSHHYHKIVMVAEAYRERQSPQCEYGTLGYDWEIYLSANTIC